MLRISESAESVSDTPPGPMQACPFPPRDAVQGSAPSRVREQLLEILTRHTSLTVLGGRRGTNACRRVLLPTTPPVQPTNVLLTVEPWNASQASCPSLPPPLLISRTASVLWAPESMNAFSLSGPERRHAARRSCPFSGSGSACVLHRLGSASRAPLQRWKRRRTRP